MSAAEVAAAVVSSLIAAGVRDVVISPGSRSGPIALELVHAERSGALRLHVRVDERSAGFLALGLAKAARRPAAVLTTSGTAVANLHPSLLEARHASVRLIAVTADRPARLRGTGANQTTEQPGLFPGLPCVEVVTANDADSIEAGAAGPGPLHVNVELDDPLFARGDAPDRGGYMPLSPQPAADAADAPLLVLDAATPTVVVAGDGSGRQARLMAEQAGWPLLAEPSSGSRTGNHALRTYRLLLTSAPFAQRIERVVVFGHPTLSRPVSELLGREDLDIVVVGPDFSRFPHPAGSARLASAVAVEDGSDSSWRQCWEEADANVSAAVDEYVGTLGAPNPFMLARTVARALPAGGLLYVGSSSTVRDLDVMAEPWAVDGRRLVLANRGLAGIDGTVSSAIGAALARRSTRAFAYLGDLTFLHDANGLLIGPGEPIPDLTLVVASDDGGAIFSSLEQGGEEFAGEFERVFGTPTGTDIAALCAAHGVMHERITDDTALETSLSRASEGLRVVEVPLARADRRRWEREIRELAAAILAP